MKGSRGYSTLLILAGKISSMKEVWGTQAERQNPEKLGGKPGFIFQND